MADQIYYSVFTQQGLALLTEAIQNGTKLGITSMAFGDGGGSLPEPQDSVTALVNEVYRTQLNSLAPDPNNANWLRAEAIIASAIGGFNIRELGLYAGDVLVAYSNYPATYKPNPSDGTARIMTFRMVLQIDNTANFDLVIDPDIVLATVQYVNENLTDSKIKTWSGISLEKHNKVQKSILDFGGVEGDTCPRLSDSFTTLDGAKAAYPDIADKITSLDFTVNDVSVLLASNSVSVLHVPKGTWRFTSPFSIGTSIYLKGQGAKLIFDKAEWRRRGASAGLTRTAEQYTLYYTSSSNLDSDIHVFMNDTEVAWTWFASNVISVPSVVGSATTDIFTYYITNGYLILGDAPQNINGYCSDLSGGDVLPTAYQSDSVSGGISYNNTRAGARAGLKLTTGGNNTYFGARAGCSNQTTANNVAIGYQAGYRNTSGGRNTVVGSTALEHCTTGSDNVVMGLSALGGVVNGSYNTALGSQSLAIIGGENNVSIGYSSMAGLGYGRTVNNTVAIGTHSSRYQWGENNVSIGYSAGRGAVDDTTGTDTNTGTLNTNLGYFAGGKISSGNKNVAVGANSNYANTTGNYNTIIGADAHSNNAISSNSVAVGYNALNATTTSENVAVGSQALSVSTNAYRLVAVGTRAMSSLKTGKENTAVGFESLLSNIDGVENTTLGLWSGRYITGSFNVILGSRAGYTESGSSNVIIGRNASNGATGSTESTVVGTSANRVLIDGTTVPNGISNYSILGASASVSASNQVQLGNSATTTYTYGAIQGRSDIRDKTDIEAMSEVMSDFILGLNPVQGRWDMRDDYVLELFPLPTAPTIPTYVDLPVELSEYEVDNEEAVANYKLQLDTATSVNEKLKAEYDAEYAQYTATLDARKEKVKAWWANPTKDASKKRCRKHNWFIAQEVKALADQLGIDFAGLQDHKLIDGTDTLTLGYEEFIPPMVLTLQKVWTRLDAIDERLKALETL